MFEWGYPQPIGEPRGYPWGHAIRPGDEWPEAPRGADYHDGGEPWWSGFSGHGWFVLGAPPPPFPIDGPFTDRAKYGPPGTAWTFDMSDLLLNWAHLPGGVGVVALNRALLKLGIRVGSGAVMAWRTPEPPPQEAVRMRWIHATINAKLGDSETMSHTLNFRTAPTPDADQDTAALQTFALQLRDIWAAWMATPVGGNAPHELLSRDVVYQDVTAAYLEQTEGARITPVPSRKTGHSIKEFAYPRPTYLVPTQFATFAPGVAGTDTGITLPYEVACVLSLTTGLRGPRNRGRLYLGGLPASSMAPNGQFQGGVASAWANLGAALVHNLNTGTGARVHVVSRAYATSVGVNGVRVGSVPDSQRRRRKSRQENFGAPIAT